MSHGPDLLAIRSDLIAIVRRVDSLIETIDEAVSPKADLINMDRTKAIEKVLEDNGGIMRPVEIWSALVQAGRHDPKMEVQATTFDLWRRGRIGKRGRGEYLANPSGS